MKERGNQVTMKTADYEKMLIGCTVTQRCRQVKQPRGGYINPKVMEVIELEDNKRKLNPEENINPGLIGLAVDYLSRYMSGASVEESFEISMRGAAIIKEEKKAKKMVSEIKGLGNKSIINAVKLSGFDVCYRADSAYYRPVDEIKPDALTINNIRTTVERSIDFLAQYGPKILDGFTFDGGYTEVVISGDGDFMTKDTLWDFKVSKAKPRKEHTLQLLMYWRMGLHSNHVVFNQIKYLGIYNPRLNTVFRLSVDNIPADIIREVDENVIGYKS